METLEKKPRKPRTITKPYQKHKEGKKILIKHYLNLKIKSYFTDQDMVVFYSVYVQITFNGQTTLQRSATNFQMSKEEFELTHKTNEGLMREKAFLEHLIKEKYEESKGGYYFFFREVEPHDFDLTVALKSFDFSHYSFDRYISKKLFGFISYNEHHERFCGFTDLLDKEIISEDELTDDAIFDMMLPPIHSVVPPDVNVHIDPYLYLLTYGENSDFYNKIKGMYSDNIWLFSVYFWQVCTHEWLYLDNIPLTIVDYRTGFVAKLFRKYGAIKGEKEKYESITAELESFIAGTENLLN